jgi:hypothetical protein
MEQPETFRWDPAGNQLPPGKAGQRHPLFIEKWDHPVVEQVRRYQRGLAIIELGRGQFGVGIRVGGAAEQKPGLSMAGRLSYAATSESRYMVAA